MKNRARTSSGWQQNRRRQRIIRGLNGVQKRHGIVEQLERRVMLAAINWMGGTGNWNTASNWSTDSVPGNSDDVIIPASGNVTISTGQAVSAITTAAGSSLTIGVGAQLSVSGTGGTISGSFDWGGVLTGNGGIGSLTLAGNTTFTGSTDGYPVINSGTFTSTDGELYASTFTNNGTFTITNGIVLAGGITFTNSSTGTVNITDSAGFNPSNPANGIGGTFINQGTLNWAASGATNVPGGLELENLGGTLNITSGNVTDMGGAAFQNGQIQVATGATLAFDNGQPGNPYGTNIVFAGTITGSGTGTIALDSGNFYAQAPGEVASDGTLDFPQGMVQVGNVDFGQAGGTLTNTGYLQFSGSNGHGALAMTNEGTIALSGTSTLPVQTVLNDTSGVIDLQSDAGIINQGGQGLTNKGLFEKTGGGGTSIFNVASQGYFNDGGSLSITTGTISFQGGNFGYIAGPISIATGSVLNFDTTNGVYIQGALSSTGGGTVTVTDGWFDGPYSYFGEDATAAASLNFAPNTLFFEGGEIENDQQTNLINTGTAYFPSGGPMAAMENAGLIFVSAGQYALPKGTFITNDASGTIEFTGAISIVTGVDSHIVNAGLIQFDPGASGTIDLATPFPFDTFRFTPGIANTGTFEVVSGTLKFPTISFGANLGNIDTGTFQVNAGTSLISDTTDNITTNNGNVILLGNAFFPDIASLATNNGGFTVGAGATFSTAGSLANTGTLTVGGNLTVNGDLTESGTSPVLNFIIGGAPGSSGAPSLTVTGNTTLAGNLTATFANGFVGSSGASYTVANFTNAASGSFASTAGVGPDFTVAVNPTSIVLNSTGGSESNAVDLDITSITGITDGSPGSTENISWNVTNEGPGAASGTWRDSVYLTTNGIIDANSILLGRVNESTALAAGASYAGTLAATLPVLPVAIYKIVVLVDSGDALPDSNRANNVHVSAAFTTIIPTLTLNSANNLTIAPGQQLLYRLIVPAGADVSLGITFPTIDVAVGYASFNAIPTASSHDESFVDFAAGSMFLPVQQAGSYYILVQGTTAITSPQNFTLTPEQVPGLNIESISPADVPNRPDSTFTLTITGSGFTAATTATLTVNSSTLADQSVLLLDPNTIIATFQLPAGTMQNPDGSYPNGNYDVNVSNGTSTARLPQGLNLFPGSDASGGGLLYYLDIPSFSRGDLYNTAYLEYSNTSRFNIPAPYFLVFGDNTSFELADQTSFTDAEIEVFGGATSGLAGTLTPGEGGVIPITYTQTTIQGHQEANLEVAWVDALPGFDPSSLLIATQPANEPNDTWAAISSNFTAMANANPQSLTGLLRDAANALSLTGVYTSDPAVLMNYAIQEAGDFGAIDQRYNLGAFGRGQSDPYAVAATSDSNGNVTITSGGEERLFIKQTNGTYQGVDGDAATLALAGGVYTLTETDGNESVFNSDGTLNFTQDTNGNRVTYNYTGGELTSLVTSYGDTYSFTYDSNGRITQATDPEGRVTTYTYDSTDQLLQSITNALGTTSFTYYSGSNLADMYAITSVTYPDGSTRDYTYDDQGRMTSQQWSDGSQKYTYTYDDLGHQTTTDALGNATTLILSPNLGTTSIIDALGNIARIAYNENGQVISQTSPENDSTTSSYDSAGNLASTTDPLGNTTSFTYDPTLNRLLTLTDADGNESTFAYDADGNLITVTDAAGKSTTDTYNSIGQLTSSTTAAGRIVAITYTSFGQVATRTYADNSTITYTYDAHRNLISAADSLNGTITYTYNSADRLTSVTEPGGLSLTYTYNSNGQLASETDQTGFVTNYTYNIAGQITQITNSSGAALTIYTYDADGNLTKTTNTNGTYTTYDYDADNNVTAIVNHASGGSVDSEFSYTYDANHNRLTETTLSGTTDYTYDADNQLIKVVLPGGRTISYAYDAVGNRITVSDTAIGSVTYSVNNLDQYVTVGSTTYGYDVDGNLISSTNGGGTTTYTYNDRGQLASANVGGVLYTYGYDALGDQSSVTVNGVTTNYLIDNIGNGNIVGAYNSSSAVVDHYIYGNGLAGAVNAAGNDSFYDFDATGNTADITNANGVVSNTYSYLPFGELLSSTGGANLFTYGGQYGAQNTGDGLYQMGARAYDPAIGRFIQRDPASLGGGDVNLYRYAGNNPVNQNDPTGHIAGFVFDAATTALDYAVGTIAPAVNTGSFFTSTGALAADTALSVTAGGTAAAADTAAALAIPAGTAIFTGTTAPVILSGAGGTVDGVVVTGSSVFTGTTGSVTFSGAVNYGVGVTGTALGLAGALLVAPIAAEAGANYINSHYPDGFPVDVQYEVEPDVWKRTVKRPLVQQLVDDFIKDNGHPPDRGQLATLIAYARSLETGNPNQFILTHLALLGITDYLNANDPNDLIGPAGFGSAGFIQDGGIYPYEITFENEPTASAPAKVVTITEQLDSNLDWTTFQLGTIAFGLHTVTVPTGLMSYTTTVSVSSTLSVNIVANFDMTTGLLTYTFTSIDPTTGDIPSGALDGFLPPDDSAGDGYGYVTYTINPQSGLSTGTAIHAQASIVFDNNAAINTPNILNTTDSIAPTSTIAAIAATQSSTNISLTWSGSDDAGGSGIANYQIYVSVDGGDYRLWQTTTATSGIFSGLPGHTYSFYSLATDNAGNIQQIPATAQATTSVPAIARTITVSGKTKQTYTDSAGHVVTVSISGPGSVQIDFLSNGNADPADFIITGTTAKSSLTITVAGHAATNITDIQITGSLDKFTAASANFTGTFTITGNLASLTLASVAGIGSAITISGTSIATTFKFGAIANLALTSSSPIKSFSAASWTATNGFADSLSATSVGTIKITGNFDANITASNSVGTFSAGNITGGAWAITGSIKSLSASSIASSTITAASIATLKVKGNFATDNLTLTAAPGKTSDLNSFTVSGAVTNSQIRAAGNIGKANVGSMASSVFFAGVSSSVTALPTSASDFAQTATITSFIDKGTAAFSNSEIAASNIDVVQLRNVTTNNNGTSFGVATHALKSFALYQANSKPFTWKNKQSPTALSSLPGDLRVSLV